MQTLHSPGIAVQRQEYHLTKLKKISHLVCGACGLAGAGFFFKLAIDPLGRDFALIVALLSLIAGCYFTLLALRSRLVLDGDRIEFRSALRTIAADRSQIEGFRHCSNSYGGWTRIYLKDHAGAFNVHEAFDADHALRSWMRDVPDLDKHDAEEILHQLRDHRALPHADRNALKQAKAWNLWLSVVAAGFGILAFFHNETLYRLSILSLGAFSVLAIFLVHRFPLLFTIFKSKVDPRSDISSLLWLPFLAIAYSFCFGSSPSHLVDFSGLFYWCGAVFAGYVVALFRIAWNHTSRWGALFGVFLFGAMYSIGVMNAVNTLPDHVTPMLYRTYVTGKKVSHSSKSTTYYLRYAPWGPVGYYDDVDVSWSTYQEIQVGDSMCNTLHPGYLHAPWYSTTPCPK